MLSDGFGDGGSRRPVRRRRVVTMNDQPFTVMGVMPASFEPLISERFYHALNVGPLGYDRS